MTRLACVPLVLGCVCVQAASAQDLRLFEEPDAEPTDQVVGAVPQEAFTGNGQPAFTLRSISRFGDQYHATMLNRAGELVPVSWIAGQNAPVANTGFTVVAAGPGTLSLAHPAGDSCVNAPLAGVSCADGARSELRLAVAAPLASNGAPPVQGVPGQQQGFINDGGQMGPPNPFDPAAVQAAQQQAAQNGQQVFINPFSGEPEVMPQLSPEEQAARQQRQEMRRARLRQFEQPVIEDAEVPPGMQRVTTPFGDRLMPIRE